VERSSKRTSSDDSSSATLRLIVATGIPIIFAADEKLPLATTLTNIRAEFKSMRLFP
jgi:hypothetical protein